MALPIFYGYSPTSLKYAWHHLSPGGIFLYLATLNHIISLLSGVVSHHVSEIWTMSTSSGMMIDYIFEVGVASSLFYGHVHAMSKFLVACFDIFKAFTAYSDVLLASLKSWCLATVLYTLDVWAMLPLKICANVECCRGFIEKMNVGTTLVQMKFWHGFMNVGTASVRMKCWRNFMAKWSVDVTSWLHECWHGIGANRALTWLHECWHGIGANRALTWLHECWHDFSANGALTWLHECRHDFGANEVLSWLYGK